MKIVSVDVIQLKSGNAGASRGEWRPVILRVNTDEGISGFGEVGLAYGKGWRGGFGMVCDFAETIIGANPLNIEAIWNNIFRNTFWGMGGGTVVSAAMSGIDIALWDILGKSLNVPVYQLLGGKTNDRLRVYASQLQYGWGENISGVALRTPEEYAEVTKLAINDGYDAIKVDPIAIASENCHSWNRRGWLTHEVLSQVYDRVSAMRDIGGDDFDIIIELHANTDVTTAVQLGQKLKDLNIMYMEEPVHPLNPMLMQKIKDKVDVPLAAGERIYTRFGYRPYFENRTLDVIQPDICLCGGISEAKKICDMALAYEVNVQIHVCGSPISKAAALQVEAAIPNFIIHEHHQRALNPTSRASCIYDYQPVDGVYEIPDRPGIGQEPTEDAIEQSYIQKITDVCAYRMS